MKIKSYVILLVSCCVAAIFNYIPFSLIIGSSFSFFSFSNGVMPLLGVFGGSYGVILCVICKFLIKPSHVFSVVLVHKLPGICTTLYWVLNRFFTHVIIPLMMVCLFLIHPVGSHAFLYPLLWFIPIICYWCEMKTFFFQALSATFLGHAVGSVAWLYMFPAMSPYVWHSIIPIAFIERVFFALIMSFIRYIILFVHVQIKQNAFLRDIMYERAHT